MYKALALLNPCGCMPERVCVIAFKLLLGSFQSLYNIVLISGIYIMSQYLGYNWTMCANLGVSCERLGRLKADS